MSLLKTIVGHLHSTQTTDASLECSDTLDLGFSVLVNSLCYHTAQNIHMSCMSNCPDNGYYKKHVEKYVEKSHY